MNMPSEKDKQIRELTIKTKLILNFFLKYPSHFSENDANNALGFQNEILVLLPNLCDECRQNGKCPHPKDCKFKGDLV